MFDDEKMLQETSEAEEIENETNNSDVEPEVDELSYWDSDEDEADESEETEDKAEETEESKTNSGNEEEPEQKAQEETNPDALFPGEFEIDGVTRQVTMTEATGLVKKGLLYGQQKEKYLGKLKDAYSDPRISFVDELAAAAGQTAAEYIANVQKQKDYKELLETYGDLEDVPASVMKLFTDNAESAKQQIEADLKAQKQKQWEDSKLEELENFRENHPEVVEIPKEALELVAKGETLEGAYARTELAKAKKQISDLINDKSELEKSINVLKQNEKNKQTKLPSSQNKGKKVSEAESWWD